MIEKKKKKGRERMRKVRNGKRKIKISKVKLELYSLPSIRSPGNIIEVGCECDRSMSHSSRATGRYCDQELDVCVNCFNASACDSSKTTNYCAPCPEHTQGNGYLCRGTKF